MRSPLDVITKVCLVHQIKVMANGVRLEAQNLEIMSTSYLPHPSTNFSGGAGVE